MVLIVAVFQRQYREARAARAGPCQSRNRSGPGRQRGLRAHNELGARVRRLAFPLASVYLVVMIEGALAPATRRSWPPGIRSVSACPVAARPSRQDLYGFARRPRSLRRRRGGRRPGSVLRVWRELVQGSELHDLDAWAFRTTYRLVMDRYRVRRRLPGYSAGSRNEAPIQPTRPTRPTPPRSGRRWTAFRRRQRAVLYYAIGPTCRSTASRAGSGHHGKRSAQPQHGRTLNPAPSPRAGGFVMTSNASKSCSAPGGLASLPTSVLCRP